jgi:hypothetical protein
MIDELGARPHEAVPRPQLGQVGLRLGAAVLDRRQESDVQAATRARASASIQLA